MASDAVAYTFTGHEPELAYFSYRDLGTGATLVAVPGQSYQIAAVEEGRPVPPDGRWVEASSEEGQAAAAAAQEGAGIIAAQEAAARAEAAAAEAANAEGDASAGPGKRKRAAADTGTPDGTGSTPGGGN